MTAAKCLKFRPRNVLNILKTADFPKPLAHYCLLAKISVGQETRLFSAVYYYKLETALENYDQYFIEKPTKLLEYHTGFNRFHTSSTLNQCNKVLQQHLALLMPD